MRGEQERAETCSQKRASGCMASQVKERTIQDGFEVAWDLEDCNFRKGAGTQVNESQWTLWRSLMVKEGEKKAVV